MVHIILSNELIKRWRVSVATDPVLDAVHPALVWRVQRSRVLGRRRVLLCTNESSLHSFLVDARSPMSLRKAETAIRTKIQAALFRFGAATELIRQAGGDVVRVKHVDRRVLGTMLDQRHMYECYLSDAALTGEDESQIEDRVNQCPFSLLGMDHPSKVFPDMLAEDVRRMRLPGHSKARR